MKIIFLSILLLASSFVGYAQVTFETHDLVNSGPSATAIIAADINNDGWMDMISSNGGIPSAKRISLLVNDGFGNFNATYLSGIYRFDFLDTADFNHDGNIDFVVTHTDDSVVMFIGNGDGAFTRNRLLTGDYPNDLTVADFNKDGNPDIIVLHRFSDDVYIYYGDGIGGVGTPQIIAIASNSDKLTAGDFDNDGNPDFATGSDTSIDFYGGDGTGNFAIAISSAINYRINFMATYDLDGDGNNDILIHNSSASAALYSMFGNGDGTFSVGDVWRGASPLAVDFDGDGNLDLVASLGGRLNYYPGDGTKNFDVARRMGVDRGGQLAAADWNNDGFLDLAASKSINSSAGQVQIILGKGDGYFKAPFEYPIPNDPRGITMGDFNGDGLEDIATCAVGTNNQNLYIFIGQANGTFVQDGIFNAGIIPVSIEAIHINGDAFLDLAVLDQNTNNVNLFTGDGTGSFTSAGSIAITANYALSVADVNKDNITDLILAGNTTQNVQIFKGNGDTTFSLLIDMAVSEKVNDAIIADIDGDTNPDLTITVNPTAGPAQIWFYQGDGSGAFSAVADSIALVSGGNALTVADINTDGFMDIISNGRNSSKADILVGDGTFTFATSTKNVGVSDVSAVADFDGDGILDLLITGDTPPLSVAGTIDVYDGDGSGTFGNNWFFRRQYTGGYRTIVSDFNNDGKNDIATLSNNGTYDELCIMLNTTIPPACNPVNITSSPSSSTLCESGIDHTLSVSATGDAPITYQWQKDGVNISGAPNTATYTLNNYTTAESGVYRCVVSNVCGTDTSSGATIAVLEPVSVTTQPTDQNVVLGGDAKLDVVATGDNLAYQWEKESVDIVGETAASLLISNISITDEGSYACVVSNSCSFETSDVATVSTLQVTGLGENRQNLLVVYPNPSSGIVHITATRTEHLAVKVYSIHGQVVYSDTIRIRQSTIDLSNLPNGTYSLVVISGETTNHKTILIYK